MSPKVIFALYGLLLIMLLTQMQGALSQKPATESDVDSVWKKIDEDIKEIQAAKKTTPKVTLSADKPQETPAATAITTNKMPATEEEWQFILCTTLMTTATVGSKKPNSTIISRIKDLCPKLARKLNESDPVIGTTSLDKLMLKLQEKIYYKEENNATTKDPNKIDSPPKQPTKPGRKTRGARAARSSGKIEANKEFLKECKADVTKIRNGFNFQIEGITKEFEKSVKSYAFFGQRTSDLHDATPAFVSYAPLEKLVNSEDHRLDNATGMFTAPVHGQYYFKFQGVKIKQELSKTYNLTVEIVKEVGKVQTTLAKGHIYTYDYYSYYPIFVQATVVLKEDETVGVKLNEGWLHEFGNDEERFSTSFTGFLIKKIEEKGVSKPGCSQCSSRT